MSLLLDALKKAADDKQKAVKSGEENPDDIAVTEDTTEAVQDASSNSDEEDLTLELDDLPADDTAETAMPGTASGATGESEPENGPAGKTQAPAMDEASLTISDEALSLLIHKTNHDVKRDNRVLIIGSLLAGIMIIASVGVYYYFDTQEEIASLERKHSISMQQMREKTGGNKTPEPSAIIRNLVSDETLDDKVNYAREHVAGKKDVQTQKAAVKKPVQKAAVQKRKPAAGVLSIERTHKRDPLDEILQAAWLAYEGGRYDEAKGKYRQVLAHEEQNRDALLGLAAIALKEKDVTAARRYYFTLLELDPRDPIANAGLSSMQSDTASAKEHEEYLQSMLQKNPGAAALNFALANVYARQGKWQAAQQYYFNAWQADADNADYIYNLAVSLDQLGKTRQALSFYRDSLKKGGARQVGFSREAVRRRIQELSGV